MHVTSQRASFVLFATLVVQPANSISLQMLLKAPLSETTYSDCQSSPDSSTWCWGVSPEQTVSPQVGTVSVQACIDSYDSSRNDAGFTSDQRNFCSSRYAFSEIEGSQTVELPVIDALGAALSIPNLAPDAVAYRESFCEWFSVKTSPEQRESTAATKVCKALAAQHLGVATATATEENQLRKVGDLISELKDARDEAKLKEVAAAVEALPKEEISRVKQYLQLCLLDKSSMCDQMFCKLFSTCLEEPADLVMFDQLAKAAESELMAAAIKAADEEERAAQPVTPAAKTQPLPGTAQSVPTDDNDKVASMIAVATLKGIRGEIQQETSPAGLAIIDRHIQTLQAESTDLPSAEPAMTVPYVPMQGSPDSVSSTVDDVSKAKMMTLFAMVHSREKLAKEHPNESQAIADLDRQVEQLSRDAGLTAQDIQQLQGGA